MQKFKQFAGFLSAVLTVGLVSGAFAGNVYNIPDGSGDSFFDQMKNALAKCAANNWDEIVIAKGEYQLGEDDHSSKNDGGVSVFETPVQKVIVRGATGNAADVVIKGGKYRFFYSHNKSLTVRDLTVVDFDAREHPGSQNGGGAFRNYQGDNTAYQYVVVSNCVVKNCQSSGSGGAIANATAYHCTFLTNSAPSSSSGAAYATACYDCWFLGNTAGSLGGGAAYPKAVSNCVFVGNQCNQYDGGAVGNCSVDIYDSYFTNNVAKRGGGGVCCSSKDYKVLRCVFNGNESQETAGNFCGGGVFKGTVIDSFFTNNVSLRCGGAAYQSIVIHSPMIGNKAPNGGAVYECECYDSLIANNVATSNGGGARGCALISNCVFVANQATGGGGGAAYACSQLIKCAFTNNSCTAAGGAINAGNNNIVDGCSFGYNSCPGGQQTAGQYIKGVSSLTVKNCVFDGENVDLSGSTQSAWGLFSNCESFKNCVFTNFNVYSIARASSITLVNCLLADSVSPEYAFFRADTTGVNLLNCTIVNTKSKSGCISQKTASSTISNSIFCGNETDAGGAGYVRNDLCLTGNGGNVATGNHNCYGKVLNDAFPVTGEGNFQVDKVNFVGEGEHPYQLTYKQKDARIRTGGAVGDWTADDKDLAGNPRLHGEGAAATISLGCYECWEKAAGLVLLIR